MAETPPVTDAFERRNRALAALAALDQRVFAAVWASQREDLIMIVEEMMVNVSVDTEWACTVVGVKPKPLPVRSGPSGNGKAPVRRA